MSPSPAPHHRDRLRASLLLWIDSDSGVAVGAGKPAASHLTLLRVGDRVFTRPHPRGHALSRIVVVLAAAGTWFA